MEFTGFECRGVGHTVNTVGVMGKGIALQFKRAFPHNLKPIVRLAATKFTDRPLLPVTGSDLILGERLIINFPTKRLWFLVYGTCSFVFVDAKLVKISVLNIDVW
jgi:hypothetical protein